VSPSSPRFDITTAPFVSSGLSTRALMGELLLVLVPVVGVAAYYFGVTALLLVAATCAGALFTEWIFTPPRKGLGNLLDGSALLTGVLIALTLPPSIPLWMAVLGGAVGIALGKTIWGGLGQNLFNPALVGRAFLQAAFPTTLTTWTPPGGEFWHVRPESLAWPLMRPAVDVTTTATPLGLSKFEGQITDLGPLLLAAVLLILCGLWLGFRRAFDWRLPISALLAVVAFGGVLHLMSPDRVPHPLFMLLSGGLLFGAVFMVTDPVTTPITPRGAWIFGAGVGFLVVLIRLYGGLPEGVMYSILLMNSVTPLINRYTQPRRFGG